MARSAIHNDPMRRTVLVALAIAIAAMAGCGKKPHAEKRDAKAPHASAESIPPVAVAGTLHGVPFTAEDARYFVDRRQGYEKVQILLSAAKAKTPCGRIDPNVPAVWLRRHGAEPIKGGETRITVDGKAAWRVHYQVREAGHEWAGSGEADALLVLKPQEGAPVLDGELSVCFADTTGSCVSGSFQAEHCPVSIDLPVRGTDTLERLPDGGVTPPGDAGAATTDGGAGLDAGPALLRDGGAPAQQRRP